MVRRIDLDELLYGDPAWEEVVEFWKNEDFCGEEYLVQAIKKYLRTDNQKNILFDLDLSIEEMLNGRYGEKEEEKIFQIYEDWNKRLGFRAFGH